MGSAAKDRAEHARWEEEARERWGDTEAYEESARRTKGYTDADWARIQAEQEAVVARFAELMAAGEAADGKAAKAAAEEARLQIDRNFYPCSKEMHVGLAEMYTADPRFRSFYDDRAEGLADFVASAIRANAGP